MAMKSGGNRIGLPRSGSRQTQSETASTLALSPRMEVRRSAENRPMPLQKVRMVSSSPNRGKRLDADPRPPHDPRPAALESRIDQVRVGDVLEPAGDRVQTAAACRVSVGDSGPHLPLICPTHPRVRDDLRELGYLSSSSESASRSSMDHRSGIWSRSATIPKSIFPQ